MPKRFDLIVFDWDGTLLDSAGAIVECMQLSCRDLGLEVPSDERARYVIGLGLADALQYAVPELKAADYPALIERYRYHFLRQDVQLRLFDGTRPMLQALRGAGHLLAVATGKSAAGLDRVLRAMTLTEWFATTRCADQTAPKPDPSMLREIIAELEMPPERVLMIGDTSHDLQMAARAGVAALGVSFGAHPLSELTRWPSLDLVHSTSELDHWLQAHA